MARALGQRRQYIGTAVDWTAPDAGRVLGIMARDFLSNAGSEGWTAYWCAGAGTIGSEVKDFESENLALSGFLDALSTGRPGTVFFSSSAGGIYGNAQDIPITETTTPGPISPYGRNKLRQEAQVTDWSERTGSRAVIGRISNLYGPGQDLGKSQGLVSKLCISAMLRRPLPIYVSLDTLRDYLFVDDGARVILRLTQLGDGCVRPGESITKILASGSSISIGGLVNEVHRVLRQRPAFVSIPLDNSIRQGKALAFRSLVHVEADVSMGTPLGVGIHKTAEGIRRILGAGGFATEHRGRERLSEGDCSVVPHSVPRGLSIEGHRSSI